MVLRRGIVACAALVMSALALAGCGSSSPTTAPSIQPSAVSTPINTPHAVAVAMLDAIRTTDIGRFCALVVPSQQTACNSPALSNAFATARVSDAAVHQTVISGNRALVSITGRICLLGRCQRATDPKSGMPSARVSFGQAWRIALTPSAGTAAGSPFERINGQWYALLT